MKQYETMLSPETVNKIKGWVDGMKIDVEELESAEWDSNIYGVEPQYAVGGWVYDEDEYYKAQCDMAIEYIIGDCASAYFNITDDEMVIFETNGVNIDEEFVRVIRALKDGAEIVA